MTHLEFSHMCGFVRISVSVMSENDDTCKGNISGPEYHIGRPSLRLGVYHAL